MRMVKVVLSTYHLIMKFQIKARIGEVRDNKIIACECYLIVVRGKQKAKENFIISLDNAVE